MDEFTVRKAPSGSNKKFSVFKLHKDDNVSWTEQDVKMRRENSSQPWQIKFSADRNKPDRPARRFKATKDGGVGENASYYIFYRPKDRPDTFEVCPIEDWYSMSATNRYKALTAEEAEQKFEERHKMFNLFSVMHLKKNGERGEDGPVDDDRGFKVSEIDDWNDSGDEAGASAEEDDEEGGDKKKLRKKKGLKKDKGDMETGPEEGKEDSDEGDFEQREVDYMSESSSSSSDQSEARKDETDVKGIAEEEALRDLLATDDEDEENGNAAKGSKTSDNKLYTSSLIKKDPDENGSDDSSDSDDYDVDDDKIDDLFTSKDNSQLPIVKHDIKTESLINEASGSGSAAGGSGSKQQPSTSNKRKTAPEVTSNATVTQPPLKRPCPANEPTSTPASGQEKIVEDLIRKYLSRKPMTLKGLLKDIKSKLKRMEGVTPEMDNDLVSTIASIIKRLDPEKQKINDVTYLSLARS